MKVRIELPEDQYNALRQVCEPDSQEYRILMVACVEFSHAGERIQPMVEILCDKDDLDKIIALTNRLTVDVAKKITRSLSADEG